MLDKKIVDQLAHRLNEAEKSRKQIRQFSLEHPEMTIEDGYAIQRAWVALKIAEGRALKGIA